MKMVPPISPFPNVYTRAWRAKSATVEKSKSEVLPEVSEVDIQQKI